MIRAVWFYGLQSARNRVVKRTRNVRYLAGMALVLAYLYFAFGRSRSHGSASGSPEAVVSLFVLLLVIGSLFNWLIENSDHPLALSKAQAQFLIAAPLTSRQVMLFKLLTFLPAMLWSAIVMGLVFRGGLSPHRAQRILTAFIVIVALQLQWVGAALARAPNRFERGLPPAVITGIVRLWLVVATAVALAQTASLAAEKGLFGLDKMGIPFAVASWLPWSLVVWPFRALLAPAHAENLASFASSTAIALLIVAVEAALVFQAEPQWDRIGIARTREEKLNARRSRKRNRTSENSPWKRYITSLVKRPAVALTWKNLISGNRTQQMASQLVIVVGVPVLLVATLLPPLRQLTAFAAGLAAAWTALLLFAGPMFVRNDLRLDLPRLRLLRTYPVTSLEICIAEVAASVSVLTLLQLVLLTLSTAALMFNPAIPLGVGRRIAFAVALACLLPGMNAINMSAQNVFAVVFPKWTILGMKRPRRSTNPGQYYLLLLISASLFLISMIIPAIAAVSTGYALWRLGMPVAVISGALVAGVLAIGEAALVLRWMATLFDRVDLASVTGE